MSLADIGMYSMEVGLRGDDTAVRRQYVHKSDRAAGDVTVVILSCLRTAFRLPLTTLVSAGCGSEIVEHVVSRTLNELVEIGFYPRAVCTGGHKANAKGV